MRRKFLTVLFLAMAGLTPAAAQEDPAFGLGSGSRPKRELPCMDDREQKAEALIRAGIILREICRECTRRRIDTEMLSIWNTFDAEYGEQILASARLRDTALQRNYPDVPNVAFRLDSRLIASTGLLQKAKDECNVARLLLESFTDYDAFVRHAHLTELGRVKNIYPLCRTRNNRGTR